MLPHTSLFSSVCLFLLLGLLNACASVTSGTTQTVSVQSSPYDGAECQLTNEKGSWSIAKTPANTSIARAYGDLVIACHHSNGAKGSTAVSSSTVGSAFGNILLGGIIGAAVDMSSGAAYEYPSTVNVLLARSPASGGAGAANPVVNVSGGATEKPAGLLQLQQQKPTRERLQELLKLREDKLISEQDYHAKVKEILAGL